MFWGAEVLSECFCRLCTMRRYGDDDCLTIELRAGYMRTSSLPNNNSLPTYETVFTVWLPNAFTVNDIERSSSRKQLES